jgi:hypothetical protein
MTMLVGNAFRSNSNEVWYRASNHEIQTRGFLLPVIGLVMLVRRSAVGYR